MMQSFGIARQVWEIEFPVLLASFRKIEDSAALATTYASHGDGSKRLEN